uniref:Serine/arginine repetitive matrix protein 1-like isoform X1 n=2 Tax=Hirondellea gigas TaxID=1518452 RepID=A0A6A7FVN3_9CRUS
MVRSPVHRPQARSPRSGGRPQQRGGGGGSPSQYSRPLPPLHRRSPSSPSRRRPNSRVGGGSPSDDPRRRGGSPHQQSHHHRDGPRHRPPLSSNTGNAHHHQPRMSESNRMVASMRMRMDDYAPPKQRRNDQGAAIPPLMEQVVVRARREASTRTKDTFWTKKLLDAEDQYSKRGDRWAHSGFKELYRDELGYSEPEQQPSGGAAGGDGGSAANAEDGPHKGREPQTPRDPRAEPRDPRRSSPNRPRDPRPKPRDPRDGRPSPDRPRDPRDPRNAARPRDPRRPGDGGPPRRNRSRGRSGGKQPPPSSARHHRRRRSYSGSYSSGSSSSSSVSYSRSRSRSYYSRSSYSRSSSGSSSYTSSSSSRSRSRSRKRTGYGKRRRSRSGSRSYSSSLSPPRNRGKTGTNPAKRGPGSGRVPPPLSVKEKKPGVLQETTKKVVIKTVSNVVTTKTKMINSLGHGLAAHIKQTHRIKEKLKIKEDESLQRKKLHGRPPSYPDQNPAADLVPTTSYYPNDEVNDTTIANRNMPPRNAMGGAVGISAPNLSQPPPPISTHHHHNPDPYPGGKNLSKKSGVIPPGPQSHPAEFPPPVEGPAIPIVSGNNSIGTGNKNTAANPPSPPHSHNDESGAESSSSSEDEDLPRKMTLSERFGKLAQLSSQRQEYDGVRMKIVREGGQDKKVYLEAGLGSRSPSPLHPGHERWLAEHQTEYAEYQRRYGDIRSWDPHRDLPRDLPPNWEEVSVRYRYYKQSGYFGDRHISLEDYLKWEDWWYQYRDWLKKYGSAAEAGAAMSRAGKDGDSWGEAVAYDRGRMAGRWPQDSSASAAAGQDRKRRRF